MNLKRRLEGLELRVRPAPTRTEIEARELNEEIAHIERQMRAEGLNPEDERGTHAGVSDGLPLDEEIELLESELETEPWD